MLKGLETFQHLLAPLKIGNTVFKNHIFAAPTGFTESEDSGQIGMAELMYLERKAMGGVACVTISEVNADPFEKSINGWPRSIQNRGNYNYTKVADQISRHGAVPSLEINFEGMMARLRGNSDEPAWGPVNIEAFDGYTHTAARKIKVKAMPENHILAIIAEFGKAALAAKNAGFQMVKVHAAHGWGLQQFYSPSINTRTDRWGGSVENRCRFVVGVVDEIHRVCGRDFPVEVRISGAEIVPGGYDIDEACRVAQQLDGHADIIHVSVGKDFDDLESFARTELTMFYPHGRNMEYAAAIKKCVKHSLVGAIGGLSDPFNMEQILAEGKADIIYMARELICEPDMPNKIRYGKVNEVRKCMRCMHCYSYCMNHGSVHCAITPQTGREREIFYSLPAQQRHKMLVIGGGIAGMQAALTASDGGHTVILCEKSDKLGGNITCERDVPFKQRLHQYIEQQKMLLENSDVEVRVGVNVTPEYIREVAPDAVIAAVGSEPVVPHIPGVIGAQVVQAIDVYASPELAKGKVVILGAGLVGSELAIYLHDLGKPVDVIEMNVDINDGGNEYQKSAIKDMINQKHINFHFITKALEITDEGLLCEDQNGKRLYAADTVILAVGMRAKQEEAMQFANCAKLFYMIGDCNRVSNIANATATAYTTAYYLGRYV